MLKTVEAEAFSFQGLLRELLNELGGFIFNLLSTRQHLGDQMYQRDDGYLIHTTKENMSPEGRHSRTEAFHYCVIHYSLDSYCKPTKL